MRISVLLEVAVLATAVLSPVASAASCHALALSGGGDRGAYEAGAVSGLTDCLPAGEGQWHVVTGSSAGAINAAGLAQFRVGDERAGSDFLVQNWLEIAKGDVWKEFWPGGLAEGLFLKSGLLDTSPERKTLARLLNRTRLALSDRLLVAGTTRLEDGAFVTYSNRGRNTSVDAVEAIMASSAIPGLFPRVKIGGHSYVDGGVSSMTPIVDAVARCRELFPGIANADITIDIVLAAQEPRFGKPVDGIVITPFVLLRTLNDVVKRIYVQDVRDAHQAYPGIRTNVISPSKPLPGYFLGFDHAKEMIGIGYADAQASCVR